MLYQLCGISFLCLVVLDLLPGRQYGSRGDVDFRFFSAVDLFALLVLDGPAGLDQFIFFFF